MKDQSNEVFAEVYAKLKKGNENLEDLDEQGTFNYLKSNTQIVDK